MKQSPLNVLGEGLSPAEMIEFAQAMSYIDERLDNNQGRFPEGSVGQLLNKLSPNVRDKFKLLSDVLETPRVAPFAPKLSERDYAEAFELDPDRTELVKGALDMQEVAGKLQDRMGVDKPSDAPPTLREQIASATELHSNE